MRMLKEEEIKAKLFAVAEDFRVQMRQKNYVKAKHAYDTAILVATFVQLDKRDSEILFGKRGEDHAEETCLFDEASVQKCYYETCVRKRYGWADRTEREFREGQPAQTTYRERIMGQQKG